MARGRTKPGAARIRPAAFRRTRSDRQPEAVEDCVQLIAELIDEKGEARGSDVALRLGVANATLVKTLKRLQDAGLVTQDPCRSIFLTGDGWQMAEDGRRKRRIVESFLLALGVPEETARIDSTAIEHHASEETLRAMARFLARKMG